MLKMKYRPWFGMGELVVEFCCEFCRTCKLFTSQLTSVIAAVLFTVHPVHTEAVSTHSAGWHRKTMPLIEQHSLRKQPKYLSCQYRPTLTG